MTDGRSMLGARPTGRIFLTTSRGLRTRVHLVYQEGDRRVRCGKPAVTKTRYVDTTTDLYEVTCVTCFRNAQSDAGLTLLGWPEKRR